jgi:argininosuccinate lyase
MRAAATDDGLIATDLADALVERGLAFRKAHEVVGRLVAAARTRGRPLRQTTPAELRRVSPLLDPALLRRLTAEASVRRRRVVGGTAPAEVRRRLQELEQPRRRPVGRRR